MVRKGIVALTAALGVAFVASSASADAVVKFGLTETGVPDVEFTAGTLSTIDDGDGGSIGEQATEIDFVGFLEGVLADIDNGSFTIDNVVADGAADVIGDLIVQNTIGGSFSLWDDNDVLLLSGDLGAGVLLGSTTATTGSFFNTDVAVFTGGTLLAFVQDMPAGISIALAGITTNGQGGLQVDNGTLQDFVGDGTGVIDAEVPEPATAALLFSGLLMGVARRRKA